MGIQKKIKEINKLLESIAIEANRKPEEITLLAVSKKQSIQKIFDAYDAGQRDFGENFVQEGLSKIREMRKLNITWHFIGHYKIIKLRLLPSILIGFTQLII